MNWLLQHPAVSRLFPAPQRIKSPHYFDINYWRGPRWYASHFPTRAARHRQERRSGSLGVVGEASPYYLFHPAVPERVAVDLPDVRVIVLLREPVSRAYSNYWDRRAFGSEDLDTFEAAIEAEPRRLAEVDEERLRHDPRYYSLHHDHHSYLARGRYVEQLARWMPLVPPERMLVLSAERLFRTPAAVFVEVQDFLRLPRHDELELAPFNRRPQPGITASTRAELVDYYRPYNDALFELLGTDLGW